MLLAGVGGFLGTCCRFLVGKGCEVFWHSQFPLATFIVNVAGCFLIGLIYGLVERGGMLGPRETALLATGFCGGFTTFSTFANDAYALTGKGEGFMAGVYVLGSLAVGYLLLLAGREIVRPS